MQLVTGSLRLWAALTNPQLLLASSLSTVYLLGSSFLGFLWAGLQANKHIAVELPASGRAGRDGCVSGGSWGAQGPVSLPDAQPRPRQASQSAVSVAELQ